MPSPATSTVIGPRKLVQRLSGISDPRFSICVMVTDWEEYADCMASFERGGFSPDTCEFLVMDNSIGNRADAFVTCNEFLQSASGDHIIICHQDILLLDVGRTELETRLTELDRRDPSWAVCGNAGNADDGWPAVCIAYHDETTVTGSHLPSRVISLDENFLVVRRSANLALSHDLKGFHHYGVDLCTIAGILGWSCYVIDFLLLHKSRGSFDESYTLSQTRFSAKYRRAFTPRWLHQTGGKSIFLSGSAFRGHLANLARLIGKLLGVIPKNRQLHDPVKRARRDRRRGLPTDYAKGA